MPAGLNSKIAAKAPVGCSRLVHVGNPCHATMRKRNLPASVAGAYLMLHLVLSMTGVYTFVPNLWYGPNIFEYIGFCMFLLSLVFEPGVWRRQRSVLPCVVIVLFYFSYGLAISSHFDYHLRPAVYSILSLTFLAVALPAAISNEADLRRFARAVQIAAVLCLAACVAEGTVPRVAEFLAKSGRLGIGELEYHSFRTSGFLRNPNESANFFVLTFLLSYWCSGNLKILGRISAILGTYLSASRSGAVLLALCLMIYVTGRLGYPETKSEGRQGQVVLVSLTIGIIVFAAIKLLSPGILSRTDMGTSRAERILNSLEGMGERYAITAYWLPLALEAPIYGQGLRSFQAGPPQGLSSRVIRNQGTHNTWIMLLGELGPLGPLVYLGVIMIALGRILRLNGLPLDRLILLLMWFSYLVYTFKAHTLFDFRYYTVALSLLLFLPLLLAEKVAETRENGPTAAKELKP